MPLLPINWINLLRQPAAGYPAVLDDGNTVAWFDAKKNITKDGSDFVSVWGDGSGLGHDLLQAVGTNQPLSTADGVSFDGVDNFMKCVGFTLIQPEQIYIVFKRTSVPGRYIFDGDANASGALYQGTDPILNTYAGSASPDNANLPSNTWGIARILFNGASSKLQINETAAVIGDFGAANMNGFTLGSRSSGLASWANTQVKEIILRKTSDTASNEALIYNYLKSKYGL